MVRNIKKQFWLSQDEDKNLKEKAEKACLTEAGLLRMLLRGYEPREKPDDKFYQVMRQLNDIGIKLHQLTMKADSYGAIDTYMLKAEAERWHKFQADVEREFLRPGESNLKWQ